VKNTKNKSYGELLQMSIESHFVQDAQDANDMLGCLFGTGDETFIATFDMMTKQHKVCQCAADVYCTNGGKTVMVTRVPSGYQFDWLV